MYACSCVLGLVEQEGAPRRQLQATLVRPRTNRHTGKHGDIHISAPIRTGTLCYYKDASKRELKGSHTLSSTSSIVDLDTDPNIDAHTHTKPHVKHAFRFQLMAAGSDVVLDADSASDRLKWILAIESIVVDLRTHQQECTRTPTQTDAVPHTFTQSTIESTSAGSSSSLQRTGTDLADNMSRFQT
jgi:hypothetical protein